MKAMDTIRTIYGPGVLVAQFENGNYHVSISGKRLQNPKDGDPDTLSKVYQASKKGLKVVHLEIKPGEIVDG